MKKLLIFLVPLTLIPVFKVEPTFASCSRVQGKEYQERCKRMSQIFCNVAAQNGTFGTAYASEIVKGAYENGKLKSLSGEMGKEMGPAWVNSIFLNAANQSRQDCLYYAPQFFGTFR